MKVDSHPLTPLVLSVPSRPCSVVNSLWSTMDTSFTRWVPPSLWEAVHTDPHPPASVLKTNRRPTVPTGITARTSCTTSSVLVRAVVLHSLMGGGSRLMAESVLVCWCLAVLPVLFICCSPGLTSQESPSPFRNSVSAFASILVPISPVYSLHVHQVTHALREWRAISSSVVSCLGAA